MFVKIEKFYQKINSQFWLSLSIHILVVIVLIYLFFPIGKVYYNSFPPLGVDYYQFVNYLQSQDEHFRLPPMSWRYQWFMGQPLIYDHPWLHIYLALPFVKVLGLIKGANIYSLFTLFLFFFFTYLATYQISRNRLLAGFLSAALLGVNSLYVPLYSGGNTGFSSTLFFLPLIIFLIIKYYQSNRRRYFYAASLCQGLAFLAHPGMALFFILLPAVCVLVFYADSQVKFFSWRKLRDLFTFLLVSVLIGGPLLFSLIKLYLELVSFGKEIGEGKEVLDTFSSMKKFINLWIFLPLAISFGMAIFSKRFFDKLKKFIPFLLLFVYIWIFEWLYLVGKNPLRGNILPNRTFWLISLLAVFSIAIFWSKIFGRTKNGRNNLGLVSKIIILIGQILIIGYLGYLSYPLKNTEEMLSPTIASDLENRPHADALPDWWVNQAVFKDDKLELEEYFSERLDLESYNYRIHSLTPGFNIWWNILFKPPLTHGYYDSRSRQEQDWSYWMDTSLAGELTYRYEHPFQVSKNSALFLIDWFGIKYLEGKEIDYKTGEPINTLPDTVHYNSSTTLASYLTEDPEIIKNNQNLIDIAYLEKKLGGKIPQSITEFLEHANWLASYGPVTSEDLATRRDIKPMTEEEVRAQLKKEGLADFWVNMDFFKPQGYQLPPSLLEVSDKYVSPITSLTNSPTCYVIGHQKGYTNFLRTLGHGNYNSSYLIPIRGRESLNQISESELNTFDCVMLYLYKPASSGSWEKLKRYVENGGKLFIDTGGEVAESNKLTLPEIFPVSGTRRGSLGENWDISERAKIFEDVNFDNFDKLEYEGQPWNLSYATNLKDGAVILLSQNNQPILVEKNLGQGKVIWSGINLPFRVNYYHNAEELKLFDRLLNKLLDFQEQSLLDSSLVRPNAEKLVISGSSAKGALFKENFDKGWQAKYKAENKSGSLKIYAAGPDMMYARLPDDIQGQVSVDFKFTGSNQTWLLYLMSLIVSLILILLIIFEHKFFRYSKILIKYNFLGKKIRSWWEHDEEE